MVYSLSSPTNIFDYFIISFNSLARYYFMLKMLRHRWGLQNSAPYLNTRNHGFNIFMIAKIVRVN